MILTLGLVGCAYSVEQRPLVSEFDRLKGGTARSEPPRLTARFLGTTTIVLSDGQTTILTDGFFSRPSKRKLLSGPVVPDRGRIEAALRAANLASASAVLVAQSHHDHAMDAPYVAQMTGATIIGSESTKNIAVGVGFPQERIEVIGDGSTCRFGDFTIKIFKTPHSRPNLLHGTIDKPLGRSARAWEYKDGGNFSFHVGHPLGNILIVPSLGVRRNWSVPEPADVVFLGVGGVLPSAKKLARFWRQFVEQPRADIVYPIHWDDFFQPPDLEAGPRIPKRLRSKLLALRTLARGKTVEVPHYANEILLAGKPRDFDRPKWAGEEGCRP